MLFDPFFHRKGVHATLELCDFLLYLGIGESQWFQTSLRWHQFLMQEMGLTQQMWTTHVHLDRFMSSYRSVSPSLCKGGSTTCRSSDAFSNRSKCLFWAPCCSSEIRQLQLFLNKFTWNTPKMKKTWKRLPASKATSDTQKLDPRWSLRSYHPFKVLSIPTDLPHLYIRTWGRWDKDWPTSFDPRWIQREKNLLWKAEETEAQRPGAADFFIGIPSKLQPSSLATENDLSTIIHHSQITSC